MAIRNNFSNLHTPNWNSSKNNLGGGSGDIISLLNALTGGDNTKEESNNLQQVQAGNLLKQLLPALQGKQTMDLSGLFNPKDNFEQTTNPNVSLTGKNDIASLFDRAQQSPFGNSQIGGMSQGISQGVLPQLQPKNAFAIGGLGDTGTIENIDPQALAKFGNTEIGKAILAQMGKEQYAPDKPFNLNQLVAGKVAQGEIKIEEAAKLLKPPVVKGEGTPTPYKTFVDAHKGKSPKEIDELWKDRKMEEIKNRIPSKTSFNNGLSFDRRTGIWDFDGQEVSASKAQQIALDFNAKNDTIRTQNSQNFQQKRAAALALLGDETAGIPSMFDKLKAERSAINPKIISESGITNINSWSQWLEFKTSNPAMAAFLADTTQTAERMAQLYGNQGGTDFKIRLAKEMLDPTLSKDAFNAVVNTHKEAIGAIISGLNAIEPIILSTGKVKGKSENPSAKNPPISPEDARRELERRGRK